MSRMSQLHAELSEQAAELGFESIEQAEANGFHIDYNGDTWVLKPDINKAYKDKEEEEKKKKESKQIEMVYHALGYAKDTIAMVYKPEDKPYTNPMTDITDEKIRDYYYEINRMCCDLGDRNEMIWQKEENEN